MGDVLGPFNRKQWNNLRLLRGSIQWDLKQNNPKLKQSTDWLKDEYKFMINSIIRRAS